MHTHQPGNDGSAARRSDNGGGVGLLAHSDPVSRRWHAAGGEPQSYDRGAVHPS